MQYSGVLSGIRRAFLCCSLWCNLFHEDHELGFSDETELEDVLQEHI